MWPLSWWRWNFQNEVHALLICQDHRVCELRKHFSFLFSPFFEDFSAAQPFLLQQVNNQLVYYFLSQQNTRCFLFLSEPLDSFMAGQDQSAADQPNNLAEGHPHCNHYAVLQCHKQHCAFFPFQGFTHTHTHITLVVHSKIWPFADHTQKIYGLRRRRKKIVERHVQILGL